MSKRLPDEPLRLALPKGRMADGVFKLLSDAGVSVQLGPRHYRPRIGLPGFELKLLKPQAIVQMLQAGSRDVGLTGADWMAEFPGDAVELLDTGLDPVRLVAAAPATLLKDGRLPRGPLVVASEYVQLAQRWITARELQASVVRSFGATEVYPPEDADCIVDVAASGATLDANGLVICDELLCSSTRVYATAAALRDSAARRRIEDFVTLLQSVLEARRRVMLEVNVDRDSLERLVAALPCMREPTIASLHGGRGFAVKVAVPRTDMPLLLPKIKTLGGADIVVSQLAQIVP